MEILLLSRYGSLGASSRVRSFQYISYLERHGFSVKVSPLFSNVYLEALYNKKPRWKYVLSAYLNRIVELFSVRGYDFLLIEKELFPFFLAVFERLFNSLGVPYVVDYDDALFHRYDRHPNRIVRMLLGHKIDRVMKNSALVVTGNDYLAQRAREAGASNVAVVPTVVDLSRYTIAPPRLDEVITIGWIGSPSTSHYLDAVIPAIQAVGRFHKIRLVTVGGEPSRGCHGVTMEFWPWSEVTEVESIQAFDIGIMPLPDEPWERGKCGYKLIQYMACGIPVIASPVGANVEIVTPGASGLFATDGDEWEQALCRLIEDREARLAMGRAGRERVEAWYSLDVQAPRLEALLRSVLSATDISG